MRTGHPTPRIRLARATDAAAVGELLRQRGISAPDDTSTAFQIQRWGEACAGAAYVAEAGGVLLGLVAVDVAPCVERPVRRARIVTLIVAEQARRRDVDRALIATAEAFALGLGATRTTVVSWTRRRHAREFYRRHDGTEPTGSSFRLLGHPDAPRPR